MIMRTWRGRIRSADREEYCDYVLATGANDYAKTPGNLGFQLVTRDLDDGITEVATMSWWTSMEAIHGFAGDEPERARYYPADDRFLIDRPEHVEHHNVEAGRVTIQV